jgi:hypothetical protein
MFFYLVLSKMFPRAKHLAALFARILDSPGPSLAALSVFGHIKAHQPLRYPYQATLVRASYILRFVL